MNVAILFVVPGVVGFKNIVPRAPVAPIVKLEVAPPVIYLVADMPPTLPLSVSVLAPRVKVFAAAVMVNTPVTVGLPVIVNAVAPVWFSSRLPNVAAAFDMLFAAPVILIFPPAPLTCVPAPVILPVLVITNPPSFSVPAVSASVVSTLQLLPSVAEKPVLFIVNVAILSVVPGVVGSKNNVPRLVVELIVKFELAPLPVK